MKQKLAWLSVLFLPVVILGGIYAMSRDPAKRNLEVPTQMKYSPASLSQTVNPVLPFRMTEQPPVPGTIPRGFTPFHYDAIPADAERAGRELVNPFAPTEENLARGEQVFTNYCVMCHGASGAGDGPLIPKYPNPPSYKSDKSKALADGTLYHIITLGRNNMPAHAAQVSSDDRWKVILYIRRLQGK